MYISAAALLAAASVVVPAVAVKTFDSTSRNNVVVYWGQGAGQGQLSAVCDNDDIDIVVVGFVNVYPSAATGGYPGTNFGNQCSGTTYQTTVNGQTVSTGLLNSCPGIGPGIKACQAKGVKVLLSIGGAAPADGFLESNAAGVDFANFLWGAFGPSTTAWTNAGKPRPFGDAAFDGFDLDIETVRASAPKDSNGNTVTDWKTRGYTALVNQLRANLDSVSDTPRYLSAAPQCVVPDAYLQDSITKGLYDFIFVQLYNTAQCSAKSGLFDLNNWVFTNPNVRVFIGLLADPTDEYYLTPTEVRTRALQQNNVPNFGGIMVWDSASSQGNTKCGKEYASWMKTVLKSLPSGTFTETCPVSSSIRPSSSVFSSSIKPSSSVFSSSIKPSSSIFSSSIKPSSSVFSSSIKPSSSVFSSSIKPSSSVFSSSVKPSSSVFSSSIIPSSSVFSSSIKPSSSVFSSSAQASSSVFSSSIKPSSSVFSSSIKPSSSVFSSSIKPSSSVFSSSAQASSSALPSSFFSSSKASSAASSSLLSSAKSSSSVFSSSAAASASASASSARSSSVLSSSAAASASASASSAKSSSVLSSSAAASASASASSAQSSSAAGASSAAPSSAKSSSAFPSFSIPSGFSASASSALSSSAAGASSAAPSSAKSSSASPSFSIPSGPGFSASASFSGLPSFSIPSGPGFSASASSSALPSFSIPSGPGVSASASGSASASFSFSNGPVFSSRPALSEKSSSSVPYYPSSSSSAPYYPASSSSSSSYTDGYYSYGYSMAPPKPSSSSVYGAPPYPGKSSSSSSVAWVYPTGSPRLTTSTIYSTRTRTITLGGWPTLTTETVSVGTTVCEAGSTPTTVYTTTTIYSTRTRTVTEKGYVSTSTDVVVIGTTVVPVYSVSTPAAPVKNVPSGAPGYVYSPEKPVVSAPAVSAPAGPGYAPGPGGEAKSAAVTTVVVVPVPAAEYYASVSAAGVAKGTGVAVKPVYGTAAPSGYPVGGGKTGGSYVSPEKFTGGAGQVVAGIGAVIVGGVVAVLLL